MENMKMKRFTIIIMTLSAALMFSSCADMWKEKTNNDWEERYVWSIADIANGVLNNAYTDISAYADSYGSNFLDAATDNATTSSYSSATFNLANGLLSTMSNPLACWSSSYNKIQYIHSFLENGLGDEIRYDKVDDAHDLAYKVQYCGEALFLRAYWYFQLLQEYGGKTNAGKAMGVPLVLNFITTEDAAKYENFPRNTYSECVEQILADFDSSMVRLPMTYAGSDIVSGASSIGKPSALAAAALKSRVALYAASPAYQDDEVVKINGMGDFTVVDEDAYLAGWEKAALIADEVIKMPEFGDGFYAIRSTDLADGPTTTPTEFLWRKYHNSRSMEGRHFPPYYYGKANTVPSQNLVDAYPMANGYPVTDPASGYDSSNPYEGRDKRFYLTVYYHGEIFGNTGYPINVMEGGKDSYSYNNDASLTGYYLAKGLSKKESILDPLAPSNSIHYTPIIRRAEVFLNFAEAANEAWGPTGNPEGCKYTAYDVIKMVRAQSGGITDTDYLDAVAAEGKDAFRELIANERRLELAFENQRYYDMRRCLMDLTESVYGAEIAIVDGKVNFGTRKVADRKYNDVKYYYGPLPYDEIVKNSYLVNNMGWK